MTSPPRTRTLAATIAVMALGGCAAVAVDPEAGFPEVAGLVKERTGRAVSWTPGAEETITANEVIAKLLDGGLTAEEAVEIALLENRELQATFSDLGVAQSDLVQASLLHNPVFDAVAGLPVSGGPVDVTLAVAMDFIDLFYVPLRKRVAAADYEEARFRVAGEVLDLAWRTQAAYYVHQADQQTVEIRERIVESTAASLELGRRLRAAGNSTELELVMQQALAEEAKLELRRAEIEARATQEELTARMGLWGENAAWTLESTRLPEPPAEPPDSSRLEARAIERSIDLAVVERRIMASAEQLGLDRAAALFPEVLVGGEGEREGGDWESGPSIALALPIFDRGQARIARARAELRRGREHRHALAVRIRSVVRAARDRMLGERERALFYRDVQLPLLERVVRETQLQYNAMQLGISEALRAKERQIEAGVRYVEALRDYWLARGDLALLLSGRLPGGEPRPLPTMEPPRRFPIPTLG